MGEALSTHSATALGTIPLCVPEIRGNEWKYIKDCLDTNWVSSAGSFVDRFEQMVGDYVGANHAVATVNGTAALHIALLVAGVQPNDEVLVSTLTFIAPANAVRYVGAWPIFVDAEPSYWQMDANKLLSFLEDQCYRHQDHLYNKTTGRRVSAVIPVHILGHPCDMDPILEVSHKYNLVVIEDATESLGARFRGGMVGQLGDIACLSFNGNKLITTGGGGMILTSRQEWADQARYLTTQAKDDSVEYIHKEVGYNYRLTNLQAALGCAQMEQIEDYVAAKRRIAATYTEALRNVPGIAAMVEAPWATSVFWMYTVLVDQHQFGMDNRALLRRLEADGIQARPLWQPMHRSPAHTRNQVSECAVADLLYQTALSIPCSVGLLDAELAHVVSKLQAPA